MLLKNYNFLSLWEGHVSVTYEHVCSCASLKCCRVKKTNLLSGFILCCF